MQHRHGPPSSSSSNDPSAAAPEPREEPEAPLLDKQVTKADPEAGVYATDNETDLDENYTKSGRYVKGELLELSDVIDFIGFGKFQWKLWALCGMGHFVEAVEVSILGVLLPNLKKFWSLTNYQLGAIGSVTFVGMLLGALILGRSSDKWGRRPIFMIALGASATFALLSAFAPSITWFIVFRGFVGFGFGGNIITDVVLLAECIPVRRRGTYLATMELFYGFGALFSIGMSWLVIPRIGWRWMVGLSTVPAFILFLARQNIPESPRFLVMNQETEKAVVVLVNIAEYNGLPEEEVNKIKLWGARATPVKQVDTDYSTLFIPALRWITITLILIWFFNSFATSLFMWLPLYLAEGSSTSKLTGAVGDPMQNAYRAALLVAIGDVVGSTVLALVVRHFDRRHILRFGLFCLALGTFLLGFFKQVGVILAVLPLVAALKTLAVSLLYAYTPELYPTAVRTTGLGLCSAFHRLAPATAHLLVAYLYGLSFQHLTTLFSSLYLTACLLTLVLQYDTRYRKLQDHIHVSP